MLDNCARVVSALKGVLKSALGRRVRVRHVARKQSFAETVGIANGGFVAVSATYRIGQLLPVARHPVLSFRSPADSETCQRAKGSRSAAAAIGLISGIRQ